MRFILIPILLLSTNVALASTITCSDSKGKIVYSYSTSNYGTPPRHGETRVTSTEEWEFQGNEISKVERFDNGTQTTSDIGVKAQFDKSSRKLIAGDPNIPVTDPLRFGNRTYSSSLSFFVPFEPPFSATVFVICDESVSRPAP